MGETFAFEVRLDVPFEESTVVVTEALQKEGFGILTRIDLHDAFREKLGIETGKHCILGACNPQLAYQAVSARPDISILLPCNVAVEADGEGGSIVRITDPSALMTLGDLGSEPVIVEMAAEARARLARVAEALRFTR